MTPLAVSSASPSHTFLPFPSFGAFTQSLPDPAPQTSCGQQPTACPVSDPRHYRDAWQELYKFVCARDARNLHIWAHLSTWIHVHWAKSRDTDMHLCPWGQTQGPHANPHVFHKQSVPRCTGTCTRRLSSVHVTLCV